MIKIKCQYLIVLIGFLFLFLHKKENERDSF